MGPEDFETINLRMLKDSFRSMSYDECLLSHRFLMVPRGNKSEVEMIYASDRNWNYTINDKGQIGRVHNNYDIAPIDSSKAFIRRVRNAR